MQVGAALLDRESQELVERAYDGRAAREIAQIIEIVVNSGCLGCCWRLLRRNGLQRCGERGVDVVRGGDRDRNLALQRDLGCANGFVLDRSRDCERQLTGTILVRKKPLVLEKSRRQALAREAATDQISALDPRATIECGELVREPRVRELGHADPIDVAERVTPPRRRSALGLLRVAQRALAGEMTDEVALRH